MASWTASLADILLAPPDDDRFDGRSIRGASRIGDGAGAHDQANTDIVPTLINRPLGIADAEIVARIRASDGALYGALFDAYYQPLCQLARFVVHEATDAHEIVADVFASLWERRQSWTVTKSVDAYLFGAVRFRARRVRKETARRNTLLGNALPVSRRPSHDTDGEQAGAVSLDAPSVLDPSAATERIDARVTIERMIAELPARSQMAIYLRWHRELEYMEIGDILGLSADAARMLIMRTLTRLRAQLTPKR